MDTPLHLRILTAIFFISFSATIAATVDSSPVPLKSSSPSLFKDHEDSTSTIVSILGKLGFREIAAAAADSLSTSTAVSGAWRGPTTVFAPSDSSLLTCPTCSLPLLLREHTVPGLYLHHFLRKLAFGTKIETLAYSRCLTITSTNHHDNESSSKVFVGGMEITRPDLYNDGRVVVHGIQGFVSHLSPLSCNIERMSSLSFPPPPPVAGFFIMRLMLKDAMLRLRISGFSVLALALRVKYQELLDLRSMTVFALDDASIFAKGQSYVSDLRLHIVPNRRLMAVNLEKLPASTVLPTMEWGQRLVVTTASGGGPMAPMRINYVKVTGPDLVYNLKIAVHGLSQPFPHVNQTAAVDLSHSDGDWDAEAMGASGKEGTFKMVVDHTPGIAPTAEIEDHNGVCF